MKLTLTSDVVTRIQAQRLAEDNPGVTEIDWNGHEAYGASALDELVRRFPNVHHIGMSEWTRRSLEDWVLPFLGCKPQR